jgi:hypothetical protein
MRSPVMEYCGGGGVASLRSAVKITLYACNNLRNAEQIFVEVDIGEL